MCRALHPSFEFPTLVARTGERLLSRATQIIGAPHCVTRETLTYSGHGVRLARHVKLMSHNTIQLTQQCEDSITHVLRAYM